MKSEKLRPQLDFDSLKAVLVDLSSQRSARAVMERTVQGLVTHMPNWIRVGIWLSHDACCRKQVESEGSESEQLGLHLAVCARANDTYDGPEWHHKGGCFKQLPYHEQIIGRIAEEGECAFAAEPDDWPEEWPSWAQAEGIRAYVAEPIHYQSKLLGVLALFSDTDFDSTFRNDRWWLQMIAAQVANAVAYATAFEEIEHLKAQLESENEYLQEEVMEAHSFGEIVGVGSALRKTLQQIELVAPTQANVLILGESGTGKELVARAIHSHSQRKDRPLIKVNCASIPLELFESEFFGHMEGAFTGAHKDRRGRFELADQGTLFLDEVGEIPLSMQGKLLRVLQEGSFEAIGSEETKQVDVRIIAATNRDLKAEVDAGRFREDLYYRLSVFPIEVAALRERLEDIPLLAEHFLQRISKDLGCERAVLRKKHIQQLQGYDWPGNIRELQNVIERVAIQARCGELFFELPTKNASLSENKKSKSQGKAEPILNAEEMKAFERANIIRALNVCEWKISGEEGAAALLGMRPTTLSSRLKSLEIKRPS